MTELLIHCPFRTAQYRVTFSSTKRLKSFFQWQLVEVTDADVEQGDFEILDAARFDACVKALGKTKLSTITQLT